MCSPPEGQDAPQIPRSPELAKKLGTADARNDDGTDAKGTSTVGNAAKADAIDMSVLHVYVVSEPKTRTMIGNAARKIGVFVL